MEIRSVRQAAEEYAATLDKVLSIYERPTGDIGVQGIKNGKATYKVFRKY